MPTNQEIADSIIQHQVFFDRMTTGQVNRFVEAMRRAEQPLLYGNGGDLEGIVNLYPVTTQEQAQSLSDSEKRNYIEILGLFFLRWYAAEIESSIMVQLRQTVNQMALSEASFQARNLQILFPNLNIPIPLDAAVSRNVFTRQFQGRVYDQYEERLRSVTLANLNNLVNQRITQGWTAQMILNEIQGDPVSQFNYIRNLHNLETNVRTMAKHAETQAKMTVWGESPDVVGWRFWNVLDSSTSEICENTFVVQSNNGTKIWPIGEGPMPPLHFNCRSEGIPVMRQGLAG